MQTPKKNVLSQNTPYNSQQPKRTVAKERNWALILLVVVILVMVVSSVIRVLIPEQQPPQQENTWNGMTPGYGLTKTLVDRLGQPLATQNTPNGEQLSYKSEFPSKPHTVIVDDAGKVQFIKEHIPYDSTHTISSYLAEFGEPSLKLYAPEISSALDAYVFLEKGVVILAHREDGSVEQKWYFIPTDEQTFLNSWGAELSTEFGHQE
jgi:hypothetical protein